MARPPHPPPVRRGVPGAVPRDNVVREFFAGFWVLILGFALWRRRPGLMLLGLLPALIVGAVLIGALIVLVLNIDPIVTFLTPFADPWDPQLARLVRALVSLALVLGLVVLLALGFTAITLLVGDPFYEKIWREVELELGDFPEGKEPGFWRTVLDSFRLVLRAAVTGLLLALLSLIPVVGTIAAAILGLFLSGRLVALELTARPLEARGLTSAERTRVLRSRRPRLVGFGVAVHLCFLIPGGAVLVMPAAVAGATYLARHALDRSALEAGALAAAPPAAAPPALPARPDDVTPR
jgi:CysZ protein